MTGVVAVVIVGLFGWATYAIAAYKGIASWVWFGIGVVLSPIGIVLALTAVRPSPSRARTWTAAGPGGGVESAGLVPGSMAACPHALV